MKNGLVGLIVGDTGRRAQRGRPPALAQWRSTWSEEGPKDVALGLEAEPDLTLTISPEDARLVLEGELDPSVAYMQGRLKTAGDNCLLLRVLRWTATPAFREALAAWAATPQLRPGSPGQPARAPKPS